MNQRKHCIILHISHLISIKTSIILNMCLTNHMRNRITINRPTNRISTLHNNHTLREGVVETLEEEAEEEDLVEEEVKLHAITMENQAIMQNISRNL